MTWAFHHRDQWKDLDALKEPSENGRHLDVGGFVLADPFDMLLRRISAEYLSQAWNSLSTILLVYQLAPTDLSWGYLHSGETHMPGRIMRCPSDFTGWTSRQFANFDKEDDRFTTIDQELKASSPSLRLLFTWRSLKWRIAPDNFTAALRLIESLWTDELTEWSPDHLPANIQQPPETWLKVAQAIQDNDQANLDQALAEARENYSPLGYRILLRGYAAYVDNWKGKFTICLPN